MVVVIILVSIAWTWITSQLIDNFEDDLQQLSPGRKILLYIILCVFAPVFFLEEMLEIVIDEIIDGEW